MSGRSVRHEFLADQDDKYDHLYRARCSCGWRGTGYALARMARIFHAQHVREAPQGDPDRADPQDGVGDRVMADYEVYRMDVTPIREGQCTGGVKITVFARGRKPFDLNLAGHVWDELERRARAALREG